MRVNIRSKRREAKKAVRRIYRENRRSREAAAFENRREAQWRDHKPLAA